MMAVKIYTREKRAEMPLAEYYELAAKARIVDQLVDMVAKQLIDIPKNEERIREAIARINKTPDQPLEPVMMEPQIVDHF